MRLRLVFRGGGAVVGLGRSVFRLLFTFIWFRRTVLGGRGGFIGTECYLLGSGDLFEGDNCGGFESRKCLFLFFLGVNVSDEGLVCLCVYILFFFL